MSKVAEAMDVIIHPLVLLSVTDHYNRVAKETQKRVVGVLLGSRTNNRVDITNSFAVPFEEDLHNPTVWFLDHNYLENMFWMFKKVNSKCNQVFTMMCCSSFFSSILFST
jgi:26S proteasome regulatory subunit N8